MALEKSLLDRIALLSPEKRAQLEQRMTTAARPEAGPVQGGEAVTAPTSFAQRSQWFVNQLDPQNPFFNKTDAVRIRGPLDVPALRKSLSALIERHAVLRTGYRMTDDGPLQVIAPSREAELPILEMPIGPSQQSDLQRHLAAEQRKQFDLETGPMYRAHLVRLGDDDHVLVRTNHHIAFDRWSSAIANADLSALYAAYSAGREPDLQPLPYQYADFASWQREHLHDEALARHLEFAEAHLAGAPQVLDLPTDHPRPVTQSHRGSSYSETLDPELVSRIRAMGRAHGVTPFMACLAAFGVLIGRYARTDQFLLGVPAAGREAAGSEALVGLFINSMVLRIDLRGDPTFAGLLGRVRSAALGAMSHQELPFDVLVENLADGRAPGRTPVFQVMLDYINTPQAGLELGSLDLEPISIADEASVYDVNLYLYDDGTNIRARWEYRSDLFDRPTIVRMAKALATVLNEAVTDPDRPMSALSLLDQADRQRVHAVATGPTCAVPAVGSFLADIHQHATEQPDTVAVVGGPKEISYGELWEQAMAVSHQIDSAFAADARIAILTGRSPLLIPSLVGVLHSGRTAVMVDPAQPEARLSSMLGQVDIDAVVTENETLAARIGPGALIVDVSARLDRVSEPAAPANDAPAYVIFTSGSTGTPRAVAVGRTALENFVNDAGERYEIGPEDNVLQFASPGFDTLMEEVLPTLSGGGRLVVRPPELFSTFADFTTFVAENHITVLDLPTAYWHAWVDDMVRTRTTEIPVCVRLVIIGGEAANTDRWRAWQRMVGRSVRLVNTYGPSETTVVVSTFEPFQDWAPTTDVMPIGRPIQNTRLLVVDRGGGVVPPGVPGELVVAGAPVDNPDLDDGGRASGFEEGDAGTRYHTGDLVRMSVDGAFEYLGRIDDQLKISGVRVEPAEIEAAMLSHDAVTDAVVFATGRDGHTEIVGHFTAASPVADTELRGHLLDRLPPLMVPGRLHSHESFPLTTSGKIDRTALRDLATSEDDRPATRQHDRPPTGTEERMTRVWETVLPHVSPGLHDDFFAIGGHSLLGVRLISHASDEFDARLPLRMIYDAPTIALMATWVDGLVDDSDITEHVPESGRRGEMATTSVGQGGEGEHV